PRSPRWSFALAVADRSGRVVGRRRRCAVRQGGDRRGCPPPIVSREHADRGTARRGGGEGFVQGWGRVRALGRRTRPVGGEGAVCHIEGVETVRAPEIPVDVDFAHALGVSDAQRTLHTQGDPRRVWDLASVSKPLTALGVLVAVDRGLVDLDEPAGPEGATVRHLLAHTAGYAFDGDETVGAVGARRIYSNT